MTRTVGLVLLLTVMLLIRIPGLLHTRQIISNTSYRNRRFLQGGAGEDSNSTRSNTTATANNVTNDSTDDNTTQFTAIPSDIMTEVPTETISPSTLIPTNAALDNTTANTETITIIFVYDGPATYNCINPCEEVVFGDNCTDAKVLDLPENPIETVSYTICSDGYISGNNCTCIQQYEEVVTDDDVTSSSNIYVGEGWFVCTGECYKQICDARLDVFNCQTREVELSSSSSSTSDSESSSSSSWPLVNETVFVAARSSIKGDRCDCIDITEDYEKAHNMQHDDTSSASALLLQVMAITKHYTTWNFALLLYTSIVCISL